MMTTELLTGSPLLCFDSFDLGTSGSFRFGRRQFSCSENGDNPRQLDFRTPRTGPWQLVSVSLPGSREVFAHMYAPGEYLLFNFFPGPAWGAAKGGMHTVWYVQGADITAVERTTKKRLIGAAVSHGNVGFVARSPEADSVSIAVRLDGCGHDAEVSDAVLTTASIAHGVRGASWPMSPGIHRVTF